jgi:hypothetical protein
VIVRVERSKAMLPGPPNIMSTLPESFTFTASVQASGTFSSGG